MRGVTRGPRQAPRGARPRGDARVPFGVPGIPRRVPLAQPRGVREHVRRLTRRSGQDEARACLLLIHPRRRRRGSQPLRRHVRRVPRAAHKDAQRGGCPRRVHVLLLRRLHIRARSALGFVRSIRSRLRCNCFRREGRQG